MNLQLTAPTILRIPTEVADSLRDFLTYEDKNVTYEWRKWHKIQKLDDQWLLSDQRRKRNWFITKNSRYELDEKVKELASQKFKCLLFRDAKGYYTYSGLATSISQKTGLKVVREFELPKREVIYWNSPPEHEPRWYQSKSVELLAPPDGSRSHGAVELFTGAGKSLTMALLLKEIGLPAVIMAPTLSIANQLLADFKKWFGPTKVGQFFDSKKQADRFFVVAVSDSLVGIEENTEDYDLISNKKIIVIDESHLVAAETLAKIAVGLLKNIPYRYSFSGTQLRPDGLGLLLDAIIGDVVLEMDVRQGIEGGFISPYKAFMWEITSDSKLEVDDPIKNTRIHLRYNQRINNHAVKLAKHAVSKGRRVLILIAEVEQFKYLMKAGILDGLSVGFAHGGGLKKEQKEELPKQFHKSDPMQLVEDFDNGKFQVLVGTSCISVGTDLRSVSCIINLVGLTSEIQVRQGVIGRGTRLFPGKTDNIINDYCVTNVDKQLTHAKKRIKIFNSVYGTVTNVSIK